MIISRTLKIFFRISIALTVLAGGLYACGMCGERGSEQTATQQEQADTTLNKKDTTMIRLNVFIKTSPENRAELIRTARELVAASLKDEGCIAYDIFESSTRPDVLMICETWTNDEALTAHQKAPHFTTLVPKIHALGEMQLERFEF